jgi:unsaturated rhamnogalacturonyl hydrolase
VKTETLREAPTATNLKRSSIYIIVDPDTPTETEKPNYVESKDVKAIADWVKAGGVLVLMGNDVGNASLTISTSWPACLEFSSIRTAETSPRE